MPGQIRTYGHVRGVRRKETVSLATKMSPTCLDNSGRVRRGFSRRAIRGTALFGSISVNVSEKMNVSEKSWL